MKRETVTVVLQLVSAIRDSVSEMRRIVDEEALPVGERNVIDHSVATIASEVEVLARTLEEMLADPSKTES